MWRLVVNISIFTILYLLAYLHEGTTSNAFWFAGVVATSVVNILDGIAKDKELENGQGSST